MAVSRSARSSAAHLGIQSAKAVARRMRAVRLRRQRSVVFLHNSYYHFFYLARALRARGWDAIVVSLEAPNSPNQPYYHGEDLNLWAANPDEFRRNIARFHAEASKRFRLLHFAGDGQLSFFPDQWYVDEPWDIEAWRRKGGRIAYSISGCNSGVTQSAFGEWSVHAGRSACDRCVWQLRPDVCSDERSRAWAAKVDRYCDLVFTEGSPALELQSGPKAVREPTSMVLDPDVWNPDLAVPERLQITRSADECLVYHAFGNYAMRAVDGRDIKGSGAVRAAVERLRDEGVPVKLVFATDVPSRDLRFLQVQADIVIDQLNHGRFGATAREALMLGKPTICHLNLYEPEGETLPVAVAEAPLVTATEGTIHEVLRDLIAAPERRAELGRASRDYAERWLDCHRAAHRYERLYDQLMAGQPFIYPYP